MTYTKSKARWRSALLETIAAGFGWLLAWPLTRLVRRRPDLIAFLGRDNGSFLDNCKHLYAWANEHRNDVTPVFLAHDRPLRNQLRRLGGRAETVGTIRGAWLWLRAGTLVVDSVDWTGGMRFPASRGARVVQLWHGIPLKQVQLARIQQRLPGQPYWRRMLFSIYLSVVGRLAPLDWLLSTSGYVTEHAFVSSFRYRRVSHAGYPRNDALLSEGNALAESGIDVAAKRHIDVHRAKYRGLVGLYAPTFRESLNDPFAEGCVDLATLSDAVSRLGMLLLVKLHPWMHGRLRSTNLPGIVFVSPGSDVYPLMRAIDFLITDYSSIFFDFLLLDRPVMFFSYDLDRYLSNERRMYFDYEAMTPGPKTPTLDALIWELEMLAAGRDDWRRQRAEVRAKVFDHVDGRASRRLLDDLFPRSGTFNQGGVGAD